MDLQLSKIASTIHLSQWMIWNKFILLGVKDLGYWCIITFLRIFIEAKVRLADETSPSFKHFLGLGKSSFAKKRRAKRVNGYHKCARWTCNTRCKFVGFTSINREDKISFIKDGLIRNLWMISDWLLRRIRVE